jgi:Ca2+-binding RTX toxin-like protein
MVQRDREMRMTKIVANKKLDLSDFDPFKIFDENEFYTSQTKSTFTAVFDTTAIAVSGSGFNTVGAPTVGQMSQITVFVDNFITAKFTEMPAFPPSLLTTQTSAEAIADLLFDDDSITGSKKSDVLIGLGGDDTIKARGGNDSINVGTGDDNTATGGGGKDTFLFTGPGFVTITDFNPAADRFAFETDFFVMLDEGKIPGGFFRVGKAAKDENDFLLYDKSTGKLFLDADGNDPTAPPALLAKLVGKPALTAGDFFGV